MEQAVEISGLNIEKIAEIISSPVSQQFFTRNNDDDLIISCRYDWFLDNLVKKINLRKDEENILKDIIYEKFPVHLERYWSEDGVVIRELDARTVEEWMENELSFLAGFSLWFREKEKKGEVDLSALVSNATGEEVKASGKIEFDKERLELLKGLPGKTMTALMEMSPAGRIAYRSMDMAIIQGLSEGDKKYANSMKERTQNKSWWKFW